MFTSEDAMATNSSDPTPRQSRRETAIACGIMFFAVALLCLLLGWADGVRHRHTILHVPQTGGWLAAGLVLAALGIAFLVWARSAKRG